jgi:site-specific recombinase XerD
MGKKFRHTEVSLKHRGRDLNTWVIADRLTDSLHMEASAFLLSKSLAGSSSTTLQAYAARLMSLIEEVERDPDILSLDSIDDFQMSIYLEKVLLGERGNKGSTINNHINLIKEFYDWCFLQGLFINPNRFTFGLSNNATQVIKRAEGAKNDYDPFQLPHRYIPKGKFEEFLTFDRSKKPFIRERNEIILRLGYEVFMRRHEIVSWENLSVSQFRSAVKRSEAMGLNEVEIDIFGKGRNRKIRTVRINPYLKRKIQNFISKYSSIIGGYIICSPKGKRLNDKYPSSIFQSFKKNLMLNASPEIISIWTENRFWNFHALRHSGITNVAVEISKGLNKINNVDLQNMAGHADYSTTLIYIHFSSVIMGDSCLVNETHKLLSDKI